MSEAWELGYKYGDNCDLNEKIIQPEGMSEVELRDWYTGVDAAIWDRLS